ncbi:hypothetical protein Vi05172_g5720 [Venturia inaequalis]|nr:hypothetical protein Vi05172_g5720 [Venturia inaequalis]
MFFIGRPLTLLAIAVCTYITITWRFRSAGEAFRATGLYDENGFRKYDPTSTRPHSLPLATPVIGPYDEQQQQHLAIHTTTASQSSHDPYRLGKASSTSYLPALPTEDPVEREEYMQDILDWSRPEHRNGHWPPYEDYIDKDYDPNRWEGFKLDRDFYYKAGIDQFTPQQANSADVYLPYPNYAAREWKKQWRGDFRTCIGPRGTELQDDLVDAMRHYPVRPSRFPPPLGGSAKALGMDDGICMDRVQRYGAYGFNPDLRNSVSEIDWPSTRWGDLQNKCLMMNQNRFAPSARHPPKLLPDFSKPEGPIIPQKFREEIRRDESSQGHSGPQFRSRTAILIRTWEGYNYGENDILAIRAMISELSLRTGGEYQIFLFVNVKDKTQPIFTDRQAYRRMLIKHVPRELRDIAILWNEDVCKTMYPDVTDWQVYWHQFMPVQWFSQNHPEFDHIWNWEMDVRFIGNHFNFLDKLAEFSRNQPRKYLWERNARVYIPSHHGQSFEAYTRDTNAIIANSSRSGLIAKPVWGPVPYASHQKPRGPKPPTTMEEDDFKWGVKEEADLITLLPIWDPVNTTWAMRNKIWNFTPGVHPVFNRAHPTDDDFVDPNEKSIPRRAFINTVIRVSRKLLQAMHEENKAGRAMQAEMWPTTVALQHGFKAVYAPHPIYSGVRWPGRYADAVFNADGGVPGRWGQGNDSIYNQDREVNFRPWTWYYHAKFPRVLYRRWMGWKGKDALGELGGKEWEKRSIREGGIGGMMCLPQMVLHPVKRGDLDD